MSATENECRFLAAQAKFQQSAANTHVSKEAILKRDIYVVKETRAKIEETVALTLAAKNQLSSEQATGYLACKTLPRHVRACWRLAFTLTPFCFHSETITTENGDLVASACCKLPSFRLNNMFTPAGQDATAWWSWKNTNSSSKHWYLDYGS